MSWTLSPDSGDPIAGEVPSKKRDQGKISPPCTASSIQLVSRGKVWVLKTTYGICDGIGLVNTNVSIAVRQFEECLVSRQNTVLEKVLNALKASSFVIPAVAAAAGLVVGLALLRWSLRLLIRPAVWAGRQVSGATGLGARQLALALLVAALFEPAPFLWAIMVFFFLVTLLAYSLPLAVFSLASTLPEACTGGSAQQCAAPILQTALGFWTGERPFSSVATRAPSIPTQPGAYTLGTGSESARSVRDIIRFASQLLTIDAIHSLISALLIVTVVLFLFWIVSTKPAYLRGLATYLGGVDWRSRAGVVLYTGAAMTAFLIFALYLSVTAIVAISAFKSDPTGTLDQQRNALTTRLSSLQALNAKDLETYKVRADDLQDLQTLRSNAQQLISTKPAQAQAAEPVPTSAALLTAGTLQLWLDSRLRELETQTDDFKTSVEKLDTAISSMGAAAQSFGGRIESFFLEENTGHVGSNLTQQHATALEGGYGDWLAKYRGRIAQCSSQLKQQKFALEKNSSDIIRRLQYVQNYPTDLLSLYPAVSSDLEAAPTCNEIVPWYGDYLLARRNISSQLALFGVATGWLLRTESRDLALIVGLLGFGFFGALASSFIRRARTREALLDTELIVPALIRGVAAAVLIFLAVVGGIAVFTRADPEPNPYAVFLACFIAAVFSEDVWEWARRRQIEQLGKVDGQAVKITTTSLPDGSVNIAYSAEIEATGGTPPLKWQVTPALPAGLSLDATAGVISGKPTTASTKTTYTVTVTDSATPSTSSHGEVALEIKQ